MPRKSGIRHTSHNSETPGPFFARVVMSAFCDNVFRTIKSSASRALTKFSWVGDTSNESIRASIVPNFRSALRQSSFFKGVKRWSIIAFATPSSNGEASPVTPKVPSRIPRPARPAIWANSLGASGRIRRPSNLLSAEKAMWFTSRFSPIPIASVATR